MSTTIAASPRTIVTTVRATSQPAAITTSRTSLRLDALETFLVQMLSHINGAAASVGAWPAGPRLTTQPTPPAHRGKPGHNR